MAISMSHSTADGCTLAAFVNHWASVSRYGSTDHKEVQPFNPHFVYNASADPCPPQPRFIVEEHANWITKKFVFSSSKISDLKKKVVALGEVGGTLPTRVESLTALIYKTAVEAATQKSGSFVPSYLFMPVDVRKKFDPKLPQTTVGNVLTTMKITTMNTSETSLNVVASKIRKEKEQLERRVQSIKQAAENHKSVLSVLEREDVARRAYCCSSFCGFPFYKVDFGWGNPTGATIYLKNAGIPFILLMDTRDGDGVEALVSLVKEDMEIFEKDKEML